MTPRAAITGRTALYGVVGHPVTHSRSPQMHAAAFAALGIDATYVALPVAPDALEVAVRGAHALGFQGLNVTVPHKQPALRLCRTVDPVAARIGAVNTLRRLDAGWEGFNTDALATRSLLAEAGLARGARALLLGAGGAARAGAWALLELGAELCILARREAAAAELAGALTAPGRPRPRIATFAALADEAARADVVVNGTSVGLHGHEPRFEGLRFRGGQLAMDFVYGATAFAADARAAGARLVSGEAILVRQGALAFTLWTGRTAPEADMAAAVAASGSST
ncbi:MAG TPA: shikimate dehydrogenase (NADP+) [Anaeromyxobacter sp.]|nr:shikimate dehydrogenase (NADP+) [Anaeromyxobacter sp.]